MNTDTGEIKQLTDEELAGHLGVQPASSSGMPKTAKQNQADLVAAYGEVNDSARKPWVELTKSEAAVLEQYPPSRRVALYKHYRTGRLTFASGKPEAGFVDQKTGLEVPIVTGLLQPVRRADPLPSDIDGRRHRQRKIANAGRKTSKQHARSRAHKPAGSNHHA